MYVLRATHQGFGDSGISRKARSEGRRNPARLRAVLPHKGDGFRRFERSPERGLAPRAFEPRHKAARRTGDAAQGHLPTTGFMACRRRLLNRLLKTCCARSEAYRRAI